ncbi:MAG TPA: acyl-CoA dehydrogenase family protein, partial [Actinomycetes bacterium]|nr:acyl-CoA dehydrogenase family protein [Actinomycetes bacterium]
MAVLAMTPEVRELRERVRDLMDRLVYPNEVRLDREDDEAEALVKDLRAEVRAAGLWAPHIGPEAGGSGRGFVAYAFLNELIGRSVWAPLVFGCQAPDAGNAEILQSFGTEEQRRRWLAPLVAGDVRSFFSMTEPEVSGSDPTGLRTTAVRDGDDWVINGSKTFITNGGSADIVLVAARTSPEKKAKGISLFAVDTTLDGFSVGRVLDKVGQDESDTAELAFDNVRVSNDDLVGPLDTGFISMMQFLPQERLGSAITNLAHAKQILEETIQYAKDRQAFGQSIGRFQHIKFLLAELVTQVEVCEAYMDKCVKAHAEGQLTAVEAAKAKWWSSQ